MLGSQNRKKESRMAVAKRQGREKPAKIEQRKTEGLELGHQVEQTALLASTICIGQTQSRRKKHIKRGAKAPEVSLLLSSTLSLVGALSLTHSLSILQVFWVSLALLHAHALCLSLLHVFWVGMP